jgi:hypothetical protein
MPDKGIRTKATGCLVLIVPAAFLIVFVYSTWRFLLGLLLLAAAWNAWDTYQWRKLSQTIDPVFQQAILANQGAITPLDLSLKSTISAKESERYLAEKAAKFAAQKRDFGDRGTVYYFLTVKTLGNLFDESKPSSEPEMPIQVDPLPRRETKSQVTPSAASPSPEVSTPSHTEDATKEPPVTIPASEDATETEAIALNTIALPPLAGSFNKEKNETQDNPQVADPWTAGASDKASDGLKPLIQAELAKRLDVSASTIFKRREDPDFAEWTMERDPDGVGWSYSPENKAFYPIEEA